MKNKKLNFRKHVRYEVDFEYLEEKVQFFLEDSEKQLTKICFWELINFFSEKEITELVNGSFFKWLGIKCKDVEYRVQCDNLIARQVLGVILNLQNEKKTIWCFWYLCDYDSCNEMPQYRHSFFLAGDRTIQLDNVKISTSCMNECDQNILVESSLVTVPDSSMPLWSNMEEDQKASTLWYYQKFHQETEEGQILAIRENLESLEFEKTTISSSSNEKTLPSYLLVSQAILSSINKRLEWIVIILVAILLKMFL